MTPLQARLKPDGEGGLLAVHCAVRDCGYRVGTVNPARGRAGYFMPFSGPGGGKMFRKLEAIPRSIIGASMPYDVTCPRCLRRQVVTLAEPS